MGKASSSKKVARAKKAAGRPGAKKSYAWPLAVGAMVIVGVLLVVVSAAGRDSTAEPPRLGDHWHAAYGIYDCGELVPPLDDVKPDESGIHTHGDGLVHMHPFATRYTGEGANLTAFAEQVGLELEDDRIEAPGISRANGDECDGEEGVLQLWVWDSIADDEPTRIESDYADYAPPDGSLLTLAFAPEGAEIPKPPAQAQASLQAPADVVGPQSTISIPEESTDTSDTTAPAETTDTTAAESTDTSDTTAPTETTETTAAP